MVGRVVQGHTGSRGSSALPRRHTSCRLWASPPTSQPQAGAQSLQEAGLGWSVQCTLRGCAWGWALPPGLVPDHRGVRTGEGPAPQREDSSGDTSVCLHRQHMSMSMWPKDVVCVIPDLESFSSPHPRALRSAQ